MNKDLYKYILTLTTEQTREFVEKYDNKLLHMSNNERKKIMNKFVDLLSHKELYGKFNFGEIAVFINSQDYILTKSQKEMIVKYIFDNLYAFANSKNEKVNIFMFDLIGNCVDNKIIKTYINRLDINTLTQKEKDCIDIMLNGY